MEFIETIKNRAKKDMKTIVLPEANDERVLKAAAIIENEKFAKVILIGEKDVILKQASELGVTITSDVICPRDGMYLNEMIDSFVEIRKNKGMTREKARDILLADPLYYAIMLVYLGYADGVVAGATCSSASVIRPSLQLLKDKHHPVISSFFLMDIPNCTFGDQGVFVFSDCGLIQNPTSEELVEIAFSSAVSFELLTGDKPIVALLSHSTLGSSSCADVERVSRAVTFAKRQYPMLCLDGELQLDAAIIEDVAKKKAPDSIVAGKANVLIFPSLDAGNIGYKLVERFAHAKAYGPIMQGLVIPVNDLSRGCCVDDLVGVVAITAIQAGGK